MLKKGLAPHKSLCDMRCQISLLQMVEQRGGEGGGVVLVPSDSLTGQASRCQAVPGCCKPLFQMLSCLQMQQICPKQAIL